MHTYILARQEASTDLWHDSPVVESGTKASRAPRHPGKSENRRGLRGRAGPATAMGVIEVRLLGLLTPRRIRTYPVIGLVVVGLVALADTLAGGGLLRGRDFLAFYTAGRLLSQGTAMRLLDANAQDAFQQALMETDIDYVSVWGNPPYVAWLFVPFAQLPYGWAFAAFMAISVAFMLGAFRALRRELTLELSVGTMAWVTLLYFPSVIWLLNGQMTALWLGTLIAVFVLLRRGCDVRAGLALGILACKPQLAFGLCVVLLAARRFRALAAAGASGLGLVLLGVVTLPDVMEGYFRHAPDLVRLVRSSGFHDAGLHGSFEFATLLLDGWSPRLANVLGVLATLAMLLLIGASWLRQGWHPATRAWDLRMAASLALGVVASPHLFAYDLVLLVLPLFIVVAHYPSKGQRPLGGGSLLGTTAVLWALGLLGPVLTVVQQALTTRCLGFPMAIQLGVVAVLFWARKVQTQTA